MSTWSTAWLMVFSFQSQVGAFSCKSKMPLRVICKLVSTGLYCACPLVDIVPLTRTGSLCEYMMWLGSIRVLSIQYIFTYMKSSPAQAQEIICELPWCTYQLFMTTPFFAAGGKKIFSHWKQDIYSSKLLVTASFEDDHLWMTFRLREWVF